MLRMEIALFLILVLVGYMYFSAERRQSALHQTFSLLLIVLQIHLLFDAATVYTVNYLDKQGPDGEDDFTIYVIYRGYDE